MCKIGKYWTHENGNNQTTNYRTANFTGLIPTLLGWIPMHGHNSRMQKLEPRSSLLPVESKQPKQELYQFISLGTLKQLLTSCDCYMNFKIRYQEQDGHQSVDFQNGDLYIKSAITGRCVVRNRVIELEYQSINRDKRILPYGTQLNVCSPKFG